MWLVGSITVFFLAWLISPVQNVFAQASVQTNQSIPSGQATTTSNIDPTSATTAVSARQTELQNELNSLDQQINAQQTIITNTQSQQTTLKGEISLLTAQITEAQLSVQATDLEIEQLNSDIAEKQSTISQLSSKIDAEKASLADLLRQTDQLDSTPLIEVALSGKTISQYFADIDSFQQIKSGLQNSYTEISSDENATQTQENDLQTQDENESQLLQLQQLQQQRLQQDETQKNKLLTQTKGVQKQYQALLTKTQQSAATIRAELFALNGSAAIPFGTALEYAEEVQKVTGVPPALLLGIITEESDLGANVGTGNWKTDMKAPRDTVPFQQICSTLGLNPDLMPVSKKPWYGWGGAMGPAQFIPSTWVLYEDRIAAASGDTPPNPWNPKDAFFASGILLEDNGGNSTSPAAERLAALRYLAGWAGATNPEYAFYGNDVMSLADNYQQEINIINQ
jgi:peptidoglycan hydrolase CwlO-like protein